MRWKLVICRKLALVITADTGHVIKASCSMSGEHGPQGTPTLSKFYSTIK